MNINTKMLIIVFVATWLIAGCGETGMDKKNVINTEEILVNKTDIKKIAEKKIFFGHQSVGANVLDGIKDILSDNKVDDIQIIRTKKIEDFKKGEIKHTFVGENFDPISKITHFKQLIDSSNGVKPDIAFLKLCYLDFDADSDFKNIFNEYKKQMQLLQKSNPDIKFIHFTVPLKKNQKGIKAILKKILGKPLSGYADNVSRNKYNELIREEYETNGMLFDIAKYESTYADGSRMLFEYGTNKYFALVSEYADDDAHLNELGSRLIANKLLLLLSKVSN